MLKLLGGLSARRAHRRRFRSYRDGPMDAALGSRVSRRDRTRSRGSGICVDGGCDAFSAGGVYLADVTAGPAGHQRLIIDARSGQILERFAAPGRNWGPKLADREGGFGEPEDGVGPGTGAGLRRPAPTSPARPSKTLRSTP